MAYYRRWSNSSLQTLQRCGHQWYLKYVKKLWRDSGPAAKRGIARGGISLLSIPLFLLPLLFFSSVHRSWALSGPTYSFVRCRRARPPRPRGGLHNLVRCGSLDLPRGPSAITCRPRP